MRNTNQLVNKESKDGMEVLRVAALKLELQVQSFQDWALQVWIVLTLTK